MFFFVFCFPLLLSWDTILHHFQCNANIYREPVSFSQDLFQSVDRHQTGKISVDSLREILNTSTGLDLKSDTGKFAEMTLAIGIVSES